MMIDTSFKGIKGVKALHTALSIMRSIYYMPVYKPSDPDRDYFAFISWFEGLADDEMRKYLKLACYEGILLEDEEILSLCEFAKDSNGVNYSKENVNNLNPRDLVEILLEVSFEILKKK